MHPFKGRAPRNAVTTEEFEEIATKITEAGTKIAAIWRLPEKERDDLYREVAQDIAERILDKSQDPIRNLGGYVYLSLGNALTRRSMRISKFVPTEDDELQWRIDARQCGTDVEMTAERLRVRAAIRQLPTDYREVIYLIYFADMATKDIATLLKISPSAVHKRKKRACELLRPHLGTSESEGTS